MIHPATDVKMAEAMPMTPHFPASFHFKEVDSEVGDFAANFSG